MTPTPLTLLPVLGMPEVCTGDDVARLIHDATTAAGDPLRELDCVVVTQKIVSKAENRIVEVADTATSKRALVEAESARLLRRRGDLLISETHHGFVCANAGVDLSNVPRGRAALLPLDPDRSARHIRDGLRAAAGVEVAVVISDTFGRPWRRGLTDVAIGVAGISAILDLRDSPDAEGRALQVTEIAIADEIAAAAELVMGKATNTPVAVARGLVPSWFGESCARDLIRPPNEDLFR